MGMLNLMQRLCLLLTKSCLILHQLRQGAEGSPVVASANEAPHWMIRKTYLRSTVAHAISPLGRPFVSDAPMAEPVEPDETAHDDAYDLFGEDEEMNEPMDEGDGKDDGKDGSETTATPPFADPYTIDEDACSLTLSKMCVCVCVCVCVRVANLQ